MRTTRSENVFERYVDFLREYAELCRTYRLAIEPAEGWEWAQVGEPTDEEWARHFESLTEQQPEWVQD